MAEILAASLIRDVPDFPKPGIMFKDIHPVLQTPAAFQEVVDRLAEDARERAAEAVIGIESRGFIFAAPIALQLGLPFVLCRKHGKLPSARVSEAYDLEYGQAVIEMHTDAVEPGQRAYIVDDVLATGGTAAAAVSLVQRLGGHVAGLGFLMELAFLPGRAKLDGHSVHALLRYE
jgi:adenine phosphoribosyltransferase